MINYSRNYTLYDFNKELILGMEYVKSSHTWRRIDHNSEPITFSSTYIDNYPLYSNMVDSTIDGCDMARVPKFYFLYQSNNTSNKWFISPYRFKIGTNVAKVHPAFVYNGTPVECVYMSKYECCIDPEDSTKFSSMYDKDFACELTLTQAKEKIENRNVNGVTGFEVMNIFHMASLQMLFLFDKASPDSQKLCGDGQSKAKTKTGKSNAVWRNFHELWGNGPSVLDGIMNKTWVLYLWEDSGNKTLVNTNEPVVSSTGGGFFATMDDYAANRGLFIPKVTQSSEATSIIPDKFWSKSGNMIATHGGSWTSKEGAGLFNLGLDNTESALATTRYSFRMSKRGD